MSSPEGLLSTLRFHRFEVTVLKKYYPNAKNVSKYEENLRNIVASSNALSFKSASIALKAFEKDDLNIEQKLHMILSTQNTKLEIIKNLRIEGMSEFQKQQNN